ncbi:ABC transporter permease [Actinomadura sp. CNU-125]|uniref:ABC transporter permease n=1 Tax=Actinomadura sp. CNU-125 TaxID=1904961 RepID=UPI0009590330|nr:ABC transporter permease [Actinomadura sp. CNU-125]OLT11372.1 ABC transporter permease [Actinomadura sp. CNU-125]
MTQTRAVAGVLALPVVPPVRRTRSVLVYLAYAWLVTVVGMALFASLLPLAPYITAVGTPHQGPQWGSLELSMGTDYLGRSIFSRAVHGAQVSLVVGICASMIGFLFGGLLGMLAGYFGGRLDAVVRLLTDAMLAFPPLILLMALSSILTPSLGTLMMGLTLLVIPTFVRLARANTLAWSAREFVLAARNMGAGHRPILLKEILPNVLPSLGAYLPIVMAALIVAEGSLSFLGLGIPPPTPSWGGMINDGKDAITDSPHMVLMPALVIFLTVFSLNLAGDHLRRRFDRTLHD